MSIPGQKFLDFLKNKKAAFFTALAALLAFLAASGIAFQNTTAFTEFLTVFLASHYALPIGIAMGGIGSGVVNFFLNLPLLENIFDRIRGRVPMPDLSDGLRKLKYWSGWGVFLVTGILFGLAAISVGATGGLAILAIVAGVFVSLVTIPQELETWLEGFDDPATVAIHKRIYDINQLEDDDMVGFSEVIDELKADLKNIQLTEGLKKLKEDYAAQAEEEQSQQPKLKRIAQTINNLILHLENHEIDLNELVERCSSEIRDESLAGKLNQLKESIEEEQASLELIKKHKNKTNIVGELERLKLLRIEVEKKQREQSEISTFQALEKWWRDLTFGRLGGLIISVGNVMALSLLFTIGLAGFLIGVVGVAAWPALIIGFSVAFTFGAFTEFYFYHHFLADFCDHITYKWRELINSPNWGLGIVKVVTNGIVNGILGYTGVILLETLLVAAGIAAPPLLILAIVAGIFAGIASTLLGSDFWIRSAPRFFRFFSQCFSFEKESEIEDVDGVRKSLLAVNEQSEHEEKIKIERIPDWIFAPVEDLKISHPLHSPSTTTLLQVN